MRPLLRGAVAAAVLSLAPVAVVTSSAPASALVDVPTVASFDPDITKRGVAGSFLSITGDLDAPNESGCSSFHAGDTFLQAQQPGSSVWKNVATDPSSGFLSFPDYDSYKTNTKLRIAYPGGTSGECVYQPTTSGTISIKVLREFDISNVSGKRQPTADIKVSPKFGKKKLLVQKKKGKGYQTFRKVKTNKKGKVRLSVPGSRKGIKYRLVAPKDKNFVATKTIITATVF